ncbi:MAG TPA: hypothetical protein VH593_04560 [Ktedonobacteraceae bacterium]|jgi:hypothetical protein
MAHVTDYDSGWNTAKRDMMSLSIPAQERVLPEAAERRLEWLAGYAAGIIRWLTDSAIMAEKKGRNS